MSNTALIADDIREKLISDPAAILEDSELMRALIAANEQAMGNNIIDLRGIAMEKLEARLDQLEDTHRGVIAAAYENLAGTNQVQRAVLRLLEPLEFEDFLQELDGEVAHILRVDCARLIIETEQGDDAMEKLSDVLRVAEPGFINDYVTLGRKVSPRRVTLRAATTPLPELYGKQAATIRSEACLKLDFGEGQRPGLLLLGSEDAEMFRPSHGTDLLDFFASVFERAMQRWLN